MRACCKKLCEHNGNKP